MTAVDRVAGELHQQSRMNAGFWFQGQYFDDERGLHYNTFRYYDPGEGGPFITQDPIEFEGIIITAMLQTRLLGWGRETVGGRCI